MKEFYQKLGITSFLTLIIIGITFFINVNSVNAQTCGSYTGNAPQHMAVSCNSRNLQGNVILNNISNKGLSASGIGIVSVSVNKIPLFQYFDSVSSIGVKNPNSKYDVPYQTYGYLMEKLNFNPKINYNASNSLSGVGALNVPYSCNTSVGVTCSVISAGSNSLYGYFGVPYIGKAVDLFTLGNIFSINSPYNININSLPNNKIITNTPNSLISNCSGSTNGCIKGKSPLNYKLTTPYGNPYKPSQNTQGTISDFSSFLGGITNFIKSVISSLLNFIGFGGNSPPPPIASYSSSITSTNYCSQYIGQINNMAPSESSSSGPSNACTQGSPTTFQIQVSYSCVSEHTSYINAQNTTNTDSNIANNDTGIVNNLNNQVNTLKSYINSPSTSLQAGIGSGLELASLEQQLTTATNTLNVARSNLSVATTAFNNASNALTKCETNLHSYETNGAPVSFSSYLYLQGLNRILADFWYMEESMNGGPPIGHTNLQSWNNDINKNTYFLKKGSPNLYKGIGMKVPVSISIRSISNSGGYISNSTLTKNYYFPWIGDAVQIAQNLSEHHFQPYYPNISHSTTPQYPKLAPGEYYINNPSEHPDPLLLYLICTKALSTSDPIVRNALGTYNVSKFFSSGNCANNSSYSGTGSGSTSTSSGTGSGSTSTSSGTSSTGSFSSFSVSACNSVLNATPPSSPNLSLSTLINNAQKFIGDNYSFNRPNCHVNVPNETDIEGGLNGIPGIDCSSLVSVLYDAMGIPIPRSSVTETQYSPSMSNLLNFMYTPASLGGVSAGDIVYFFVPRDYQSTPQHEALITSYSNDQNFSTIQATYFGHCL